MGVVSGWGGCGARGRERMVVGIWLAVPAGSRPKPPAKSQPPTRQRPGRFCAIKASRKTGPDAFLKDGRFLKGEVFFKETWMCRPAGFTAFPGEPVGWNWGRRAPRASRGVSAAPIPTNHAAKPPSAPAPTVFPRFRALPGPLPRPHHAPPSRGSGGDDPPRRGPGQRPGGEVQERQRLSWWGLGQRPSSSSFHFFPCYFATAMRPSNSRCSGSCAPSHATMRSATAMPSASTSRPFLLSMV